MEGVVILLTLIENQKYIIDEEELTFEGTKSNGEIVNFKKEDGTFLEISLSELIEKEIQRTEVTASDESSDITLREYLEKTNQIKK